MKTEIEWHPNGHPPPVEGVYLVIRRHIEAPNTRFIDIAVWKAVPRKYKTNRLYEQPSHWRASEQALAPITHWAHFPEMPPE